MDLVINGNSIDVPANGEMPLLWFLRDKLGMTGTKYGCGMGMCGACTVHIDGQAARACITPIASLAGKKVTTIEGIAATEMGRQVQAAWVALGVPQCGYCQAGQIMSATALLAESLRPDEAKIDEAMVGNICRCGTYTRIRAAIKEAAARIGGNS